MPQTLIANREASDSPTKHLHVMLRKAEAKKEAARDEVPNAGVPRS
jgi:hypothetical protein